MVTLILTLSMCAFLFLMIWAATFFYPWTGMLRFFPQDIEEKAGQHKPPFPAAPVIGWIIMLLCALGFIGVILYGGWDGLQNGFTFRQFLTRFLIILFGMKAFDIIALDYVLITKTQFFQHYIPETKLAQKFEMGASEHDRPRGGMLRFPHYRYQPLPGL